MGKSFFVIKLHFKVLIIVVLIFLAASYSNSSKFSYLDGVPFAINPIFLNENEQEKFAKTESLNYRVWVRAGYPQLAIHPRQPKYSGFQPTNKTEILPVVGIPSIPNPRKFSCSCMVVNTKT